MNRVDLMQKAENDILKALNGLNTQEIEDTLIMVNRRIKQKSVLQWEQ